MKEIGGYIELDTYTGAMLHEKAMALNCGRGALEYLCEAKMIRKLYLPYFLCDSVPNLCKKKINIEKECPADSLEYHCAADILPIPIDQRYGKEDMIKIAEKIKMTMNIKEE